jgi:radical SAM superfamily enzyme YgiQ (UPF0313 family)
MKNTSGENTKYEYLWTQNKIEKGKEKKISKKMDNQENKQYNKKIKIRKEKEKMILINPPSPFLTNERVFPNLGIIQLATAWRKRKIKVRILDLNGNENWKGAMAFEALNDNIFGITSTTPQFKYAHEINRIIKEVNPDAFTIIGGPHASAISMLRQRGISDLNILSLNDFDQVICGDGEDWEIGNKWAVYHNKESKQPIPDRSLIDIQSYHYNLNGRPTTSILTQRGCAFQCTFCCGRDMEMYNKVRFKSPKEVIREMDEIHEKFGFSAFMWYDDEINLSTNRLMELCKLLTKRDYIHRGFVRTDMIVKHPETVDAMKKAGFVKLCAGIESGSDRMLRAINKGTTSEINHKARQIIKNRGIHFEAFMMLGHPGETMEDVELTKQWIKDAKPDDFDLNLTTPYPGSRMYDDATWNGKEWDFNGLFFDKPDYSKEDSFYKGKNAQSSSNIRTGEISNEEYIKLRDDIQKELKCT